MCEGQRRMHIDKTKTQLRPLFVASSLENSLDNQHWIKLNACKTTLHLKKVLLDESCSFLLNYTKEKKIQMLVYVVFRNIMNLCQSNSPSFLLKSFCNHIKQFHSCGLHNTAIKAPFYYLNQLQGPTCNEKPFVLPSAKQNTSSV